MLEGMHACLFTTEQADMWYCRTMALVASWQPPCLACTELRYDVRGCHQFELPTADFGPHSSGRCDAGWEAVMRIRCSKGLRVSGFHGHFFIRSTDLLALPQVCILCPAGEPILPKSIVQTLPCSA